MRIQLLSPALDFLSCYTNLHQIEHTEALTAEFSVVCMLQSMVMYILATKKLISGLCFQCERDTTIGPGAYTQSSGEGLSSNEDCVYDLMCSWTNHSRDHRRVRAEYFVFHSVRTMATKHTAHFCGLLYFLPTQKTSRFRLCGTFSCNP